MIEVFCESSEGGNGWENPGSNDEGCGNTTGWVDKVESLSDDKKECDGDDEHVAINGLYAELCEEAAGNAARSVFKIFFEAYDCEAAD